MELLLSPGSLAVEYAQTKMSEASNECCLQELVTMWKDGDSFSGIEILPGGTMCAKCHEAKMQYAWTELDALAKLPRHWGCTCCYISW
jgi:hypothetical protein